MDLKYGIIWEGEILPNGDQQMLVRDELDWLCTQIDKPSDLMMHTVFLTEDMDGPSIFIIGREGDDENFYASCCVETEWVTIDNIDFGGNDADTSDW